VAFPVTFIDP